MIAGPDPRPGQDPVVVSFTEFQAHRWRDLPGIIRTGRDLRRAWWAMPGAIGASLWLEPTRRRGGSLTVWTSDEHLRRFVRLPRHVAVMRRYRDRVAVRSATWTTRAFSATTAYAEAPARLDAGGR
jgi:hypothetical protein